jgi:hypothetical protein
VHECNSVDGPVGCAQENQWIRWQHQVRRPRSRDHLQPVPQAQLVDGPELLVDAVHPHVVQERLHEAVVLVTGQRGAARSSRDESASTVQERRKGSGALLAGATERRKAMSFRGHINDGEPKREAQLTHLNQVRSRCRVTYQTSLQCWYLAGSEKIRRRGYHTQSKTGKCWTSDVTVDNGHHSTNLGGGPPSV